MTHSPDRYSRVAALLHWLIALLIAANVALALIVDRLPDDAVRPTIDLHKSIGITVLLLVLARIAWRLARRPPDLPSSYPAWERRAAHWGHGLLYALILLMPLSGWLHDSAWKDAASHPMYLFGSALEWPRVPIFESLAPARRDSMHELLGAVHSALAYAIYGLVGIHVLAALKHQFIDREPELQRMWPWGAARRRSRDRAPVRGG